VGLLIDKLPTAVEAEKFAKTSGLDASELTLFGGEEYELILTVKSKLLGRAEKAVEEVGGELLPIGKVTTGKRVLLEIDGKRQVVEARGWEHFRSRAFTKIHRRR
jgi:thiamine-monophosphate kinase